MDRQDFSHYQTYDALSSTPLETHYIIHFVGRDVNFPAVSVTQSADTVGCTRSIAPVTTAVQGGSPTGALTTIAQAPQPPNDITVQVVSTSSLGVYWTAVPGATQYMVQWDTSSTFDNTQVSLSLALLCALLAIILTICCSAIYRDFIVCAADRRSDVFRRCQPLGGCLIFAVPHYGTGGWDTLLRASELLLLPCYRIRA